MRLLDGQGGSPSAPAPPSAPGVGSPADDGSLPGEAFAACLAGLSGMGPARLAAILRVDAPAAAWRRVVAGRGWAEPDVRRRLGPQHDRLVARWRAEAAAVDPAAVWRRIVADGVGVAVLGGAGYPAALARDVEPPTILFHRRSPEAIAGPRVAIVGTRQCTPTGVSVAVELGRDLTEAGVAVVSGLATGIDAAAHRGALAAHRLAHPDPQPHPRPASPAPPRPSAASVCGPPPGGPASGAGSGDGRRAPKAGPAPPIGVVATGLDVVYPRGQAELWRAVARAGVLLSETPLGCGPERWRFPARNRIIAALADVVVVVESHRRGGSLYTVDEADRRGVDVLAVPGSVRNPAAAGTNALLAEGRAPATSADDVLVALGLGGTGPRPPADRRPPPADDDRAVLDALGWQPATLDQLVLRTGLGVGLLVLALDRLEAAGWVARRGGWYERVIGGDP